jgi:hypothetical protein
MSNKIKKNIKVPPKNSKNENKSNANFVQIFLRILKITKMKKGFKR